MTSHSPAPLCPGCAEAQTLLNCFAIDDDEARVSPWRMIETMPLLLETALRHLCTGLDARAQSDGDVAMAIQLLALGAERAQVVLEASVER